MNELVHAALAGEATPSAGELEQRYFGLMQISGEAVLILCDGLIVFYNEAACELLGLQAQCDLLGSPYRDLIARGQRASVNARLRSMKEIGHVSAFVRRDLLRPDRKASTVEVAMHACTYFGRPAVQVLIRDLSEQRRLQEDLVRLAKVDALTELSNHTHFVDMLDAALEQAGNDGRGLGLVRVGLDHFRAVNCNAGQQGGDFVLTKVAERLRNSSHAAATLARLGGDEFGLVLEALEGPEEAAIAARRLMDSLSGPIRLDGADYFATVSIGIALFPSQANRRDPLLCKAMLALKAAKSDGGNQFRVYSGDLERLDLGVARKRAETQQRLRKLTPREREVFDLMVTGKSSKMIAYLLGISTRTVEIHRGRVMVKMQADSIADLVHMTF